MARLHYSFLPAGPLLRDRFDSLAKIAELSCPLLIIAGNRDRIVPDLQSRQLYHSGCRGGSTLFATAPAAITRVLDTHLRARHVWLIPKL
jgi:hypothetical protein